MARIDLDALASAYDHRATGQTTLAHAREALDDSGAAGGEWAVDVGGGPGDHAAVWAAAGMRALVVDPTRAMVHRAATREGVSVIAATAQALPLRDGSTCLVYFHLSIHYGDWRLSIAEASRVVRPGGLVDVWTLGPEHHATSLLGRYFPTVAAIDTLRFPDPSAIAFAMGVQGLDVSRSRVVEPKSRTVSDWVEAVEARFVSTLQLVPSDELSAGLADFRRDHPDRGARVDYRLTWERLRGRKRQLP